MMWIFSGIFLIPSSILLAISIRHFIRALKSESWPTVEALITRSQVSENRDEGTTYRPDIRFSYTVDKTAYESERIHLGWPLSAGKNWAESVVARFPLGSRVLAKVDPSDPTFCVLEPGAKKILIGGIAFFGVFAAVGVYALLTALGMTSFR